MSRHSEGRSLFFPKTIETWPPAGAHYSTPAEEEAKAKHAESPAQLGFLPFSSLPFFPFRKCQCTA